MLILARKSTELLVNRGKICHTQISIYEYGFELLFSTVVTLSFILILGVLGNYISQAIVFLLYFIPVRIAAGGYHAKSYGRCFMLTNTVAIICVAVSEFLWQINSIYLQIILLIGFVWACKYIWDNAPIIPSKYRGKTNRYRVNRRYAHNIVILEIAFVILLATRPNRFIFTAIITTYLVAIMMKIAKKWGDMIGYNTCIYCMAYRKSGNVRSWLLFLGIWLSARSARRVAKVVRKEICCFCFYKHHTRENEKRD